MRIHQGYKILNIISCRFIDVQQLLSWEHQYVLQRSAHLTTLFSTSTFSMSVVDKQGRIRSYSSKNKQIIPTPPRTNGIEFRHSLENPWNYDCFILQPENNARVNYDKSNTVTTGILDLPEEVIRHIFSYLPKQDIF